MVATLARASGSAGMAGGQAIDLAAVGQHIDVAQLRNMHELKTGQSVSFRVNGFGEGDFAGKVQRIDASANATTRQVAMIVAFDEPAKAPRVAGLFAEGRIETGGSDALTVSDNAVGRAGEATWVWRVEGSKLSKVAVKLGSRVAAAHDFYRGSVPAMAMAAG